MAMSSLVSSPTYLQNPTKINYYNISKHPLTPQTLHLRIPSTPYTNLKISTSSPPIHATPIIFAAINSNIPRGPLISPLTSVAAAVAKFLELYSGMLMIRVTLTWFPNVDMNRWPMSAIRDLCDPYLGMFRNIIPPVLGTLDVSPILAFSVLNMVSTILHTRAIH